MRTFTVREDLSGPVRGYRVEGIDSSQAVCAPLYVRVGDVVSMEFLQCWVGNGHRVVVEPRPVEERCKELERYRGRVYGM